MRLGLRGPLLLPREPSSCTASIGMPYPQYQLSWAGKCAWSAWTVSSCASSQSRSRKRRCYTKGVNLSIELDREDDGRWIAEALGLPGVMTYGATREEAICNTE